VLEILRIALVGGLVGLDTTAAFQVMVSQPLVGGLLAGWALGEPWLGALVGLLYQGLFMAEIPVGARTFPDGNQGAVQASAVTAALHSDFGLGTGLSLLLGFLWSLPMAYAGGRVIVWIRRLHALYLPILDRLVTQDRRAALNWLYLGVVAENFLVSAALTAAAFAAGRGLMGAAGTYLAGFGPWEFWGLTLRGSLLGAGCGIIFITLLGKITGKRAWAALAAAAAAAGLWIAGY